MKKGTRKMRMGMVGGGLDAFIGAVHRKAAALDGEIELVCGAFSADPEKSRATGRALYLPEQRVYESYEQMFRSEKLLPEGERMDFVSIVTPNHVHFAPAKAALENGFHVMLDKPLSFSFKEAKLLKALVDKTGLMFGLTHTYTGYPMIKEARHLVRTGALGKVRKIYVEYPQGWLSTPLETTGQKQSAWRTDPARSGKSGCMGDIGTHCENLVEFVTGLKINELCADLNTVVEGRPLDDDGSVLIRFEGGATGILMATQVAAGEMNALRLRVYGEKGGLDWHQEFPNQLKIKWLDKPMEILQTGSPFLTSTAAAKNTRYPAGHPEGYGEAFANLYRNFALNLRARLDGVAPDPDLADVPTVEEGLRGMAFIETLIKSTASKNKWTKMIE
jgi:predicted dehydrogenase